MHLVHKFLKKNLFSPHSVRYSQQNWTNWNTCIFDTKCISLQLQCIAVVTYLGNTKVVEWILTSSTYMFYWTNVFYEYILNKSNVSIKVVTHFMNNLVNFVGLFLVYRKYFICLLCAYCPYDGIFNCDLISHKFPQIFCQRVRRLCT